MINDKDLLTIKSEMAQDWPNLTYQDMAFVILVGVVESSTTAALMAGIKLKDRASVFLREPKVSKLRRRLAQLIKQKEGVSSNGYKQPDMPPSVEGMEASISKEENRSELVRMISVIQNATERGEIEMMGGLKLIADIRTKLNDKFDIEEKNAQQRIIVVPQKRDIICKHTNRECTFWPSKAACIKHFNLIEQ